MCGFPYFSEASSEALLEHGATQWFPSLLSGKVPKVLPRSLSKKRQKCKAIQPTSVPPEACPNNAIQCQDAPASATSRFLSKRGKRHPLPSVKEIHGQRGFSIGDKLHLAPSGHG